VSFRVSKRWMGWAVLAVVLMGMLAPTAVQGQGEITRKVKSKVAPVYPEIARRMSINGVVKLIIVVAPNGNVTSTKVLGGHPLLINAAQDAIKKWKFEPGPEESTGVVEFTFKAEN
jgi:TonB family protein